MGGYVGNVHCAFRAGRTARSNRAERAMHVPYKKGEKMTKKYASVEIDADELKAWLAEKGLTSAQLSQEMGFSARYLDNSLRGGRLAASAYKLMCLMYELPEGAFIPKPPLVSPDKKSASFWIHSAVVDKKVYLALYEGERMIEKGFAHIQGDGDSAMCQAFSYAAHMMMKNHQQNSEFGRR